MNLKSNFLAVLSLLGLIALTAYVLARDNRPRGFVMTQKVFQEFKGTLTLNSKMESVRKSNKRFLDSLNQLFKNNLTGEQQQKLQRIREEQFTQEQMLGERYTSELWAVLNKNIEEYGKEKNYEFIFGASGNGSLMYGTPVVNITDDVIEYVNKKYAAK